MNKNSLLATVLLILSLSQAAPVFAQDRRDFFNGVFDKNTQGQERQENRTGAAAQGQEKREQNRQNNLAAAKKRANREIDRRLTLLNRILQRIQSDRRLSPEEKNTLTSDIQADVNALKALKVKIDADTDIATLRSDRKSIVTNFKVFSITSPKMRLLITIDDLQTTTNKILRFTPKIQDLINKLRSEGKDVTQLQAQLDDIKSRLTTINNRLSSDRTLILAITVSSTDAKSTFTRVRQDLADVRQNLAQIRHDFAQMRETFRIKITGGDSGKGSASVSPFGSPTPTPSSKPTSIPTSSPAI